MSEMFIDEVQNNFFHLLASFPVQDFKCQSKFDDDCIIELSAMTYLLVSQVFGYLQVFRKRHGFTVQSLEIRGKSMKLLNVFNAAVTI